MNTKILQICIVSDTHGYIDPRIVELAQQSHLVIHAGDIGSNDVLKLLRPQLGLVFAVAGNNDVESKWHPSESEIVNSLKPSHTLALPGGNISVEHGHTVSDSRRYHEVLRKRYPDSRAVVFGHTHKRVVDRSEKPWVLNPGASGRDRNQGGPSCLILMASENVWTVNEQCFSN